MKTKISSKSSSEPDEDRHRIFFSTRGRPTAWTKYALIVFHRESDFHEDEFDWRANGLSLLVDLVFFGFVGIVGVAYISHDGLGRTCKMTSAIMSVPVFLAVAGFFNCWLAIYRLVYKSIAIFLQGFFNIIVLIMGVEVVLQNYSAWSSTNQASQHYCDTLPVVTAMIVVVLLAIWFSLSLVFVLVLCCVGAVSGFRHPDNFKHVKMVVMPKDGRLTLGKPRAKMNARSKA